jgi:dienelactone hydrolase
LPWEPAALLASHGYSTLALAYFGCEHLPKALVNIPLEYFATALRWLQAQETVRSEHLAVLGWSRGGELALLLGATFPQIKAVIGYVPSGVIWGGLGGESSEPAPSAWSYGGHPLPFVPERCTRAQLDAWRKGGEPYPETPLFLINLEDRAVVEAAAIPVEKINGPVLLISGEDDQLWPSTLLSEMAMDRLRKHQHPYPYRHLRYPGAGHLVGYPYVVSTITHRIHPANGVDYAYGGNAKDNAFARADSWSQMLMFLEESFGHEA